MLKAGHHPGFGAKPRHHAARLLLLDGQREAQDLDRDGAPELLVEGAVDVAEGAPADQRLEAVTLGYPLADRDRREGVNIAAAGGRFVVSEASRRSSARRAARVGFPELGAARRANHDTLFARSGGGWCRRTPGRRGAGAVLSLCQVAAPGNVRRPSALAAHRPAPHPSGRKTLDPTLHPWNHVFRKGALQ